MRVFQSKKDRVTKRFSTYENKNYGILSYDDDNLYPQKVSLVINSSPTAKACVETYSKFIGGEGFADLKFYKSVINERGQTLDKILSLVKKDLARFRGFSLHVNLNALGEITEINHVPFEHVRKTSSEKKKETGFDFAIYNDWGKELRGNIDKTNIVYIHEFSQDAESVNGNIDTIGGDWSDYKGQLLYVSLDDGSYPLSSADAVMENIYSEIQSDISTTTNIENNFSAKGMLVHKGKFADDEEAEEFDEDVAQFVGPDGARVIVVDIENDEEKPEWVPIEGEVNDKIFEYTDKKVTSRIIRNWLIPKILLSETEGAGFFNQEQVRDAIMYYNLMTKEERLIVEDIFRILFERFHEKINATGDYSIRPIEYKMNKTEVPTGLLDWLKQPMPRENKISGLELLFGMDIEDAKRLVPEEEIAPAPLEGVEIEEAPKVEEEE